ncbi:ribosome biogenesis GTPase Der [Desulfatiglans anilini]|uniref:ribosome biogenesis GTPase Der n=1 Tax=Desulfatiglans anilini TaxID=90728 RepID=UPI000480B674|nr:ribosome biogenesis GTPase Der [Desulfatiglans anilini]
MPEPIIAIVGRPNVGKSTLFNRISRSRDALVDNRPGVTRDRIHASVLYEGVRFTLVDTGGYDDLGQDPLLGQVRRQVDRAMQEADRVILVVDGRQGVLPGDAEMAQTLRRSRKPFFVAVNKIDGPEHEHLSNEFFGLGVEQVHPVSAAHGYGVRALMEAVTADWPFEETPLQEQQEGGPIRVAVLGKPNVGKSSFINRILGAERLVVSDLPGTTRDAVDTPFSFKGRNYVLIDTAGIRRKARVKEKIEKFSVIKALKRLEQCHIAVLMLDAFEGVAEQDARICGYALEKGRGLVLVINKWDLVKGDRSKQADLKRTLDRELSFVSFAPRIHVSALTGERVMKVFREIDLVYSQFASSFTTGVVNAALQEVAGQHPPPRIGHGRVRLFYATQVGSRPPAFVVFANRPDKITPAYERFLLNGIRQRLGLEKTPIRLFFRRK